MALGGGTFLTQNKVLPGTYMNFVALKKASVNISDRGFASMALELDWGIDDTVFTVTNEDFQKKSLELFGYDYTHQKLKGLRDLFLNIKTLYTYRLNSGEKATCTLGTAKCSGIRGNDLKVVVSTNIDDANMFDVVVYLDNSIEVFKQTVTSTSELSDNDFIVWDSNATLVVTAGMPLTSGTNGDVNGLSHQSFLDKVENFSFNTLGVVTTDDTIKQLYTNFTKRMRDEVGAKFQFVVHNYGADYEGVINVKNDVVESNSIADLVYWVVGISASCPVNKSNLNKKYNGEFSINCDFTQSVLSQGSLAGEFILHKVYDDICVLSDINSLVTETLEKGAIFKENQSIRVMDQIANDLAVLFNTKYLGVVPNDKSGRVSLWSDIVSYHRKLEEIRAIEDFDDSLVTVTQGESKKAVVVNNQVNIVNVMGQLYMSIIVA